MTKLSLHSPLNPPKGALFNILPLVAKDLNTADAAKVPLPGGKYLLKKLGQPDHYVAVREDVPKSEAEVFLLPGGTQAPVVRPVFYVSFTFCLSSNCVQWEVGSNNDGVYAIHIDQWFTTPSNPVVALRSPIMPYQWILQAFPLLGKNVVMYVSS